MAEFKQKEGSRFTVDLGSVKLPAIVEKQVETEIRSVVLRALGTTEFGGRKRLPESIFDTFPGRTLGLWLDPEVIFPERGGPLGPVDHTLIVRQIMSYPFHVLKALGVQKGDSAPTGTDVLQAALEVEEIDPYTKERIKAVLDILPKLEEVQGREKTMQRAVRRVEGAITGQPLQDQIRLLRDPSLREELIDDGQGEVLEATAQILEDGASSIYSPEFSFHRTLRSGQTRSAKKDTVDGVKDADAIGATAGGFAGTVIVPAVGTAAGAAAGGAGASAGYAIGALIDWLF